MTSGRMLVSSANKADSLQYNIEILMKVVLNTCCPTGECCTKYTVNPVYKGHSCEPENVLFMYRSKL